MQYTNAMHVSTHGTSPSSSEYIHLLNKNCICTWTCNKVKCGGENALENISHHVLATNQDRHIWQFITISEFIKINQLLSKVWSYLLHQTTFTIKHELFACRFQQAKH